jgi:probable F420-dependent oxidoreductase
MQIGVTFPQTEIGPDPAVVREYAQTAEHLGYSHTLVYDHVLGASKASRPDWNRPYHSETLFHEPFVLFGYLAGITERLGLVTGVIILPQRQTALVAKQAAEIDRLSRGRLRLGVGLGWNAVEYETLGMQFTNRGRRLEEQVDLLRKLWTEHAISYQGKWHTVTDAGINPLPEKRSIPIWIGGSADAALERAARIGDGWFPLTPPTANAQLLVEKFRHYLREAGRDPATVGIEASIRYSTDEAALAGQIRAWYDLGASYLTVNTMNAGLAGPAEHIKAIGRFKEIADAAL